MLAWIFWFDCYGGGLNSGTVANTDEAEDGGVAFGDAEDVVGEVGASCACHIELQCSLEKSMLRLTPHLPLISRLPVKDIEGSLSGGFIDSIAHKRGELDGGFAKRTFYFDDFWGLDSCDGTSSLWGFEEAEINV